MKKLLVLIVGLLITNYTAQDQGITGETHRRNVGKILWAKTKIAKDLQDQIKYETSFSISDPIYGIVFLEKSLPRLSEEQEKNCFNKNSKFRLKVYVDNIDKGYINQNSLTDGNTSTIYQIQLNLNHGDIVDDINKGVPDSWTTLVKGLNNANHEFKFEFFGGEEDICLKKIAEGSFTLSKPVEKSTIIPAALMKDAGLEASMLKAIKRKDWKNEIPVKVIIIKADWKITKDLLGNILRREINTNVILKKNDGTCRFTDVSFSQECKGKNKFGITEVSGIGMKNIPCDCDAVK